MGKQKEYVEENTNVTGEETFLQKVLGLPTIGEYITTFVGLIPAFI